MPSNVLWPIILQAFRSPPFRDQGKVNLVCPVTALDVHVHRAALWFSPGFAKAYDLVVLAVFTQKGTCKYGSLGIIVPKVSIL